MKKYDIVLANIPRTDPRAPYLGTFLLKSVVQNNGFTCKSFDWNRDLYEKTKGSSMFNRSDLDFNLKSHFDALWNDKLKEICFQWIKEIEVCNPDWFGMTFLSQRQENIGERILEIVKDRFPHIKTMIGGYFVGFEYSGPGTSLGKRFKDKGLVDYYVNGEGEDAIISLLNGNDNLVGINTIETTITPDINSIPAPDFSDVSHYKYPNYFIYNSRGCVNNCGFCTENLYSKGYRFRKGELVVRDLLHTKKQTGNINFYFVDSLINGNPKEFRNLVKLLDGKGIRWLGQFLCNGWMTEKDYEMAARSGLLNIAIGVESGSERIRKEMGKPFSDKHLYQTIKYAIKYGIDVSPMLVIGWPTESEEDFIQTLDFLTKLSTYDHIDVVNPGPTLRLDRRMKVSRQFNLGRDRNGHWVYKDNNYELRQERWNRVIDHCKSVGLKVSERQREKVEENYSDIR